MKLPNKMVSYSESVISKFPIILDELSDRSKSVFDLYYETVSHFENIEEYLDTLNCLFALGMITLNESEMIHFVKRDLL